jgi:hypothetical protein
MVYNSPTLVTDFKEKHTGCYIRRVFLMQLCKEKLILRIWLITFCYKVHMSIKPLFQYITTCDSMDQLILDLKHWRERTQKIKLVQKKINI